MAHAMAAITNEIPTIIDSVIFMESYQTLAYAHCRGSNGPF
jgi:hypothetical protein